MVKKRKFAKVVIANVRPESVTGGPGLVAPASGLSSPPEPAAYQAAGIMEEPTSEAEATDSVKADVEQERQEGPATAAPEADAPGERTAVRRRRRAGDRRKAHPGLVNLSAMLPKELKQEMKELSIELSLSQRQLVCGSLERCISSRSFDFNAEVPGPKSTDRLLTVQVTMKFRNRVRLSAARHGTSERNLLILAAESCIAENTSMHDCMKARSYEHMMI